MSLQVRPGGIIQRATLNPLFILASIFDLLRTHGLG